MEGSRKTVAKSIGYLMKTFPAVAIVGARQTGKTTFLKKYLSESSIYDLENENTYNLVSEDINFFLEKRTKPIIFDEAQELPKLFPALRILIDEDRKTNGQCVVTGSSSSQLLNGIMESLAGRVAIFEMNGLDLREAWEKEPSNFFDLVKDKDISSLLNLALREN